DVITLTNMFPIWVAALSWPLLRERPTLLVWLAVASGVSGIVLIQQPHLATGSLAAAVALFSSFSTALAMMGLHRLKGIDARAVVVHFSGVSLLFGFIAYFLFPHDGPSHNDGNGKHFGILLAVGLSATIGQLF